jgi:hypothetical protein
LHVSCIAATKVATRWPLRRVWTNQSWCDTEPSCLKYFKVLKFSHVARMPGLGRGRLSAMMLYAAPPRSSNAKLRAKLRRTYCAKGKVSTLKHPSPASLLPSMLKLVFRISWRRIESIPFAISYPQGTKFLLCTIAVEPGLHMHLLGHQAALTPKPM